MSPRATEQPDPQQPARAGRIQSVARATTLLTLVGTRRTNGSGKALAEAAGLAVPTAHHLLATLVAEGYLAQDEHARYMLGPKVVVLSEALQRDLTPPGYLLGGLHRLSEQTGETVYLAAWRNGAIHTLKAIEGTQPVHVSVPGPYADAHARASGKLFLSRLPDDERDAYLDAHPLRRLTPRTIVERGTLLAALARVRRQGYATEEEELLPGVSCVSAPVLEDGAIVAAYSLSVPTQRFRKARAQLIETAVAVASSVAEDRTAPA